MQISTRSGLIEISLLALICLAIFPFKYEVFLDNSHSFQEYGRIILYLSDILVIGLICALNKRINFGIFFLLALNTLLLIHMKLGMETVPWAALLTLFRFVCYPFAIVGHSKTLFKIRRSLLFTGLISIFLSSLLAIFQFYTQGSLGIPLIEAKFGLEMINVAKVVLHMEQFIRSYGTFLHPNVFAFVLGLALILGSWISQKISSFWQILFFTLFFSLILTFSRSSWVSLILGLIVLLIYYFFSKSINFRLFHIKHMLPSILLGFFSIVVFFPLIQARNFNNDTSFQERLVYNGRSIHLDPETIIFGASGAYIEQSKQENPSLEDWQHDYPHNYWLSVIGEFGLLGLIFIICLLYLNLWKSLKYLWFSIKNKQGSPLIILCILYIWSLSFMDHYFLTDVQAQIILWMMISVFAQWGNEKSLNYGTSSQIKLS